MEENLRYEANNLILLSSSDNENENDDVTTKSIFDKEQIECVDTTKSHVLSSETGANEVVDNIDGFNQRQTSDVNRPLKLDVFDIPPEGNDLLNSDSLQFSPNFAENNVFVGSSENEDDSVEQYPFGNFVRPPTPPKQLDDEDMKPSIIDFGHSSHKSSTCDYPRSILKRTNDMPRFTLKLTYAEAFDILYWRDIRQSIFYLLLGLVAIILLSKYSPLLLLNYACILVLLVNLAIRFYKFAECTIRGEENINPFQRYLSENHQADIEYIFQQFEKLGCYAKLVLIRCRSLFLIEDLAMSLNFSILLWLLLYINTLFSTTSLLVIALFGVFTIPKAYEVYGQEMHACAAEVSHRIDGILTMLCEKLPILKKSIHRKSN